MKRIAALAFLFAASLSGSTGAEEQPKEISSEEAEMLARAAAEATPLAQHKFVFDPVRDPDNPNFYSFGAMVAEEGAEGHSGWFAVNKFTAEVWNPYGCHRFEGFKLHALQQRIRREHGLDAKIYRAHEHDDPCLTGGRDS